VTLDGTDRDLASARSLAEQVIARLGPDAPALHIARVGYDHGFDEERSETVLSDEPSGAVIVEVRADDPAAAPMDAVLTLEAPPEDGVAAVATHSQDHVVEYTRGALLPPCPGHRHPLQAGVVDGVASWVCPEDPAWFHEPILST
jgi:hypothetical protein